MDLWGGTNGFTPALSGSTLRVKKSGETGLQYVSFCRSIRALLPLNTCPFAVQYVCSCRSICALLAGWGGDGGDVSLVF